MLETVPKTGKNARKVREEGSPKSICITSSIIQCTVGRPFPAHPLRACVRALETHTSCSCAVPSVSSLLLPAFPRAQKSPYKVAEYLTINIITALFDVHHGIYGTPIGTPTPVTAPTQIVCGSYMDAKQYTSTLSQHSTRTFHTQLFDHRRHTNICRPGLSRCPPHAHMPSTQRQLCIASYPTHKRHDR